MTEVGNNLSFLAGMMSWIDKTKCKEKNICMLILYHTLKYNINLNVYVYVYMYYIYSTYMHQII